MPIPNAFTDQAPAAAVFEDRLYVAFKVRGDEGIRLASTAQPGIASSWEVADLNLHLPEPGPVQIRTEQGPALSVHRDQRLSAPPDSRPRLWLAFKGHNNSFIWLASMDAGGEWQGHGCLPDTQTARAPAMAANLIVHRGNRDDRVWFNAHSVDLPRDKDIPETQCDSGPAIAHWTSRAGVSRPVVAYRRGHSIMRTKAITLPNTPGKLWTRSLSIPGTDADRKPALAAHGDNVYLAYKERGRTAIRLCSHNGRSWIVHPALSGCNTDEGPALVSFRDSLFVVFGEAGTGAVDVRQVTVPPPPDPFVVLTVNIREKKLGDDAPNRWEDRIPRIVKMLYRYGAGRGPHIVGMQEVQENQYKDLTDSRGDWMGDYRSIWAPRGGPQHWNPWEGLALFYRPDAIELLDSGHRIYTAKERRDRGECRRDDKPKKLDNRIIVWGRFREIRSGRTFYVYNNHFGGNPDCEMVGQTLILADLIANRSHPHDPIIIIGDFNVGEEADGSLRDAFRQLLERTRTTNCYRQIQDRLENSEFKTGIDDEYGIRRVGPMIDFILVSGDSDATDSTIAPPPFQVCDADIDRTMFTEGGGPVNCHRIDAHGRCEGTEHQASALRMYSDHWAVWAGLTWFPESS
jgi:endonuclease/exonuclease/phosphatase family metal-dependent hydrolase